MKRLMSWSLWSLGMLLLAAFAAALAVPAAALDGMAGGGGGRQPVALLLNDSPLHLDVQPHLDDQFVMLPLRGVFEEMGYEVHWENEDKRVIIKGAGSILVLYPGNPLYAVDGVVHRSERPPYIHNGRTLVEMQLLEVVEAVEDIYWDRQENLLRVACRKVDREERRPEEEPVEVDEAILRPRFVEVVLYPDERVERGDVFEVRIGAPYTAGIYAYEVTFVYNPERIRVREIQNPDFRPGKEFLIENVDSDEGRVQYVQTILGPAAELPPRQNLLHIKTEALEEGTVPLKDGFLKVTLLDNSAAVIPSAVEEKILYIGPTDPDGPEDEPTVPDEPTGPGAES